MVGIVGASPRELASPVLARLGEQIEERVRTGEMRPITPEQFMVNLISLCIFPFAARAMLTAIFGQGPEGFDRMIEERKESLADFFLNALRPCSATWPCSGILSSPPTARRPTSRRSPPSP
jgi:hypothetical protein